MSPVYCAQCDAMEQDEDIRFGDAVFCSQRCKMEWLCDYVYESLRTVFDVRLMYAVEDMAVQADNLVRKQGQLLVQDRTCTPFNSPGQGATPEPGPVTPEPGQTGVDNEKEVKMEKS